MLGTDAVTPEIVAEELELLEQVVDLLANLRELLTRAEWPLVVELGLLREQIIARRER